MPGFSNPYLRDAALVVRAHMPIPYTLRIERGFKEIEAALLELEQLRAEKAARAQKGKAA